MLPQYNPLAYGKLTNGNPGSGGASPGNPYKEQMEGGFNVPGQSLPSTGAGGYTFDAKTGGWIKQDAVDQTNPMRMLAQQKNGFNNQLLNKFLSNQHASTGLQNAAPVAPWAAGPPTDVSAPTQATPGQVDYKQVAGQTEDAARAAIFARNKDYAGQVGQSAMTGLQGALAGRGMGGAGYEAGQIGQTVTNSANQLGEATRQQSENELEHAQHVADLTYQGGITQRGQDIGIGGNNLNSQLNTNNLNAGQRLGYRGQDLNARGQDIQANEDNMRLQLQKMGIDQNQQELILRAILGLGGQSY